MTPAEAAAYLSVPTRTLESWRYRRTGPRFVRLGRHVRYRQADLNRFVEQQVSGAGAA